MSNRKFFFEPERPEYLFPPPAKVGGTHANNTWPAERLFPIDQLYNVAVNARTTPLELFTLLRDGLAGPASLRNLQAKR